MCREQRGEQGRKEWNGGGFSSSPRLVCIYSQLTLRKLHCIQNASKLKSEQASECYALSITNDIYPYSTLDKVIVRRKINMYLASKLHESKSLKKWRQKRIPLTSPRLALALNIDYIRLDGLKRCPSWT